MKIAAISDIHGYLPPIEQFYDDKGEPIADVLCICGDIVPLECQRFLIGSLTWFHLQFMKWAESLPVKKVLFIAGNHDFFLENIWNTYYSANGVMRGLFGTEDYQNKILYLQDTEYIIDGIKFYGTPWVKDLSNWAFYADNDDIKEIFAEIPKDTDVLLTHMPATIGDAGKVLQEGRNFNRDFGSKELSKVITNRSNLKYALCGHVHSGNHIPTTIGNTHIVNVSTKDEDYNVKYPIFVFEI